MSDLSKIDLIRQEVGGYASGTRDNRRWVQEHALGWVHTLLARVDDLERELQRERANKQGPVATDDLDYDPTVCRCAAVSRPPCGPCENGTVAADGEVSNA